MLLSDCTAPTILQSSHPLSTSLKHSHRHHHRHTHTHTLTHTHLAFKHSKHRTSLLITLTRSHCWTDGTPNIMWNGTVLCYLMGKGHKMTIFSPFWKTEKKMRAKENKICALTSMSVSSLIKHKHGIVNLEDMRSRTDISLIFSANTSHHLLSHRITFHLLTVITIAIYILAALH